MFYPMTKEKYRAFSIFILFLLPIFLVLPWNLAAQADPGGNLEYIQHSDGRIFFYAQYQGIIPVYLWVEFPQLQNLSPSIPFPQGFYIPPDEAQQQMQGLQEEIPPDLTLPPDSMVLFYLEPRPNTSTRFQIQYRFTWGRPIDPNALDHVYVFPFPHGEKYRITQGFNGAFTHFLENRYALDFNLDTGDPIHAAREGVVVAVKQDSNRGGPSTAYARDGNFILIAHEDGTFGNYVHLKQHGARVEVGQWVDTGQHIGYAGATGQASGPHLHFDVRVSTENGRFQSIPIRFKGIDGEIIEPETGRTYYAVHPGGAPFVPVFGDTLTDRDFAQYSEPIAQMDGIDIRTELIDSTTLIFLQNGHNQPYWVEVTLGLTNLTSTQGTRIVREVPPLTEVYVTILRPRNPEGGWSHRIQYRFRPLQ